MKYSPTVMGVGMHERHEKKEQWTDKDKEIFLLITEEFDVTLSQVDALIGKEETKSKP